ncbi:thymic stromal lymphopoietin [Vulpes lagopus]|uniref:thymic stromal lymphopoietin n=1 Tax=Vulpes lagopus TaxID=494514 RepID=UPI001BCA41C6|nr:thymic stromal lymphopoietin [Vulpes lagopus]
MFTGAAAVKCALGFDSTPVQRVPVDERLQEFKSRRRAAGGGGGTPGSPPRQLPSPAPPDPPDSVLPDALLSVLSVFFRKIFVLQLVGLVLTYNFIDCDFEKIRWKYQEVIYQALEKYMDGSFNRQQRSFSLIIGFWMGHACECTGGHEAGGLPAPRCRRTAARVPGALGRALWAWRPGPFPRPRAEAPRRRGARAAASPGTRRLTRVPHTLLLPADQEHGVQPPGGRQGAGPGERAGAGAPLRRKRGLGAAGGLPRGAGSGERERARSEPRAAPCGSGRAPRAPAPPPVSRRPPLSPPPGPARAPQPDCLARIERLTLHRIRGCASGAREAFAEGTVAALAAECPGYAAAPINNTQAKKKRKKREVTANKCREQVAHLIGLWRRFSRIS